MRKAIASSVNRFRVAKISPKDCHLRTSFVNCGPAIATRFEVSGGSVFFPVRLRRDDRDLRRIDVITSPFHGATRDPLKLHIVKFGRVRGDTKKGQSVSEIIRSFPNITSATTFQGSLVIEKKKPSRGHFFLSNMRVPGVGRFSARKTSKNPIKVVGPSFVHRISFCSTTCPTTHKGTLDSILSFGLRSKGGRGFSLQKIVKTSSVKFSTGKPTNGGAACRISVHHSCLRFLFSVVKLPFLPAFASTRFGIGRAFSQGGRLTVLKLKTVSSVGLGANVRSVDRGGRCVLTCLPIIGRGACALKTICGRCSNGGVCSLVIDQDRLGGGGVGCESGSRDSRRGLALGCHSSRVRGGLHDRGVFHFPFFQLGINKGLRCTACAGHACRGRFAAVPEIVGCRASLKLLG